MDPVRIDRKLSASLTRGRATRRLNHDLADMAGALHEAERIVGMRSVEDAMGERDKLALSKQTQDLFEQLARQLLVLSNELVDVDGEIGNIAPQRPQPEMGVGVEIPLA